MIASCPPLDANSAYCNLLQCTHFANTCVLAECDGRTVGWISGYILPQDPSRFFVWQVAVASSQRGRGLAGRMLDSLLSREETSGVTHVITTVTADNEASRSMFSKWGSRHNAPVREHELFHRDRHFAGEHDSEWQLEIGPLTL